MFCRNRNVRAPAEVMQGGLNCFIRADWIEDQASFLARLIRFFEVDRRRLKCVLHLTPLGILASAREAAEIGENDIHRPTRPPAAAMPASSSETDIESASARTQMLSSETFRSPRSIPPT